MKSKGHIAIQDTEFGSFEWFEQSGQVFKASVKNPLDLLGYRQGARWECSRKHFDRYKDTLLG